MDCGYQWNESNEKVCRCPYCGARLEILDTKCRTFKDKAYYSTLATQDGLQVQRVFLMNANFRKGKKAEYYSMERVTKCRNKTAIERKRRSTKGGNYGIYD